MRVKDNLESSLFQIASVGDLSIIIGMIHSASPPSVIGPENSRHFFNNQIQNWNQSRLSRPRGFSRALGSLVIFTLNSHWLLKASSFLLIGCCDKFGFGFTTLNRKALSREANDDSSTSDHNFSLTMSWFPLCSCFFSGRIQWDVVHRGPETHRFDWSGYPVHNLFLICKIVHEVLFVYTWQNR